MSPELLNSNFIAPLIYQITKAQNHLNHYNLDIGNPILLDGKDASSILNPEGIKDDINPKKSFYNKTLISGFYELSNGQNYAVNLKRQDGLNNYFDEKVDHSIDEKESSGFTISSSLMTLVLLILVLILNLVELKLTKKETA